MMKRLGNILNEKEYDLPERFAPALLDEGYITLIQESYGIGFAIVTTSCYQVTKKGKEAYLEWIGKCIS